MALRYGEGNEGRKAPERVEDVEQVSGCLERLQSVKNSGFSQRKF